MSVNKANQISKDLTEEDQSQHQILPFTIATVEVHSFQSSNPFNSSHIVQATSNIEFSEITDQQPCDIFSLQAKKYSDTILTDQSSETISNEPIKWMSSKMRLMRKMMAQEQMRVNNPRRKMQSIINPENRCGNISPSGILLRVCSVCNTTKTPLWRSGPQGPKSLCNACGIRQMKARRAVAATSLQNKTIVIKNESKFDVNRIIPYKKRYKFTNHDIDHEKLKFDDSSIGLKESSSAIYHSTFPKDEKDAAILLMALSFG